MKRYFIIVVLVVLMSSCKEVLLLMQDAVMSAKTDVPVSNSENILGLKNSLDVGVEKSVLKLGVVDAFYKNEALKILLPPEAQPIVDNISLIPGGAELLDRAVLSLNRSAEEAVVLSMPIFKDAILGMTITDATKILFGEENAATVYLKSSTYQQLSDAFAPKIKTVLEKPLVANVSTLETWNTLSVKYNTLANSSIGRFSGLKPVAVNLEAYVTAKTLNGLFLKIAEEEKNIRNNPSARINDLLRRVFGQLDR